MEGVSVDIDSRGVQGRDGQGASWLAEPDLSLLICSEKYPLACLYVLFVWSAGEEVRH